LAEAAHLGCVIGNLLLITAFCFQPFRIASTANPEGIV
jgi:hypothetical protein